MDLVVQRGLHTSTPSRRREKYLSVWSDDLASFFWNNGLAELPDSSVVLVTHSTARQRVASFMARGYDGEGQFAIPARILSALGGATW